MSYTSDVVVYGTVCLDLLWRVEVLPPPGGYVEILEEKKAIGGEAANTAIALAKWGVRTALQGNPIGTDADGLLLMDLFRRDVPELSLAHIKVSNDVNTPYCVCMATPDGQRTMIGYRFANLTCTPLDEQLAASAKWFTVEPNAYDSGVSAAIAAARAGARVIAMDYAREPLVNSVATVILTSSEHVGRSLGIQELSDFAGSVRDTYNKPVVVTVGEKGCIVARPREEGGDLLRFPAYRAPEVVDTTGSGDVFRAGLLYGLNSGESLEEAIKFGAAAASLNCAQMGGWGGVRPVEEIIHHRDTAELNPV